VSLTFASYDDDIQLASSPVQAESAGSNVTGKYGLSSSAAQDLETRFKSGGDAPAFSGRTSAMGEDAWVLGEEWGLARPDTSYDMSMGTKSATHSLPTSSSLGFGEALTPGERSLDALTPPSAAVGRGFDFSSALGTASGSSTADLAARPSPSSERAPRRAGDATLGTEPDPWADNPW
jgi:hypothetical protein